MSERKLREYIRKEIKSIFEGRDYKREYEQ